MLFLDEGVIKELFPIPVEFDRACDTIRMEIRDTDRKFPTEIDRKFLRKPNLNKTTVWQGDFVIPD